MSPGNSATLLVARDRLPDLNPATKEEKDDALPH
jgi:hypothetical protein